MTSPHLVVLKGVHTGIIETYNNNIYYHYSNSNSINSMNKGSDRSMELNFAEELITDRPTARGPYRDVKLQIMTSF